MNTRLQVEHPVTEMITGKDLVKEQILIAEGRPLSFAQEDLQIQGHAIEIRVYAEDPKNNFLPDTGKLITYKRPQGPGVRVDDGFEEGMSIPIFYDPLIAKLITYDESREKAITRMVRAIDEYQITGIETTLAFCKFVMQHKAFRSGEFDTDFIKKYFSAEDLDAEFSEEESELLAAMGVFLYEENKYSIGSPNALNAPKLPSNWKNRLK
jgi:propionyl-CoA carboxylase alpha chain